MVWAAERKKTQLLLTPNARARVEADADAQRLTVVWHCDLQVINRGASNGLGGDVMYVMIGTPQQPPGLSITRSPPCCISACLVQRP